MTLGKKVAVFALVSTVGLTSAFAYGPMKGQRGDCFSNQDGSYTMMKRGGKRGHSMRGGSSMMFLYNVDLTAEQSQDIRVLKAEQRLEMMKSFDIADKKAQMKKVFTKEGFDAKTFVAQKTETNKKRVELQAKYMEKIYNILTPEQRAKVIENIEKFEPMAYRK